MLFEKVAVSKRVVWNWAFWKAEYLVKVVKKYFFKKTKFLGSNYKSGDLSYKLPKMTKCIYKEVYSYLVLTS